MNRVGLLLAGILLCWGTHSLLACCAVSRPGSAVVNADQTVLIIWNPETKTQHFLRKATFKSDTPDIGFLVPSPTKPELGESGNEIFTSLQDITKPEIEYRNPPAGVSCGCAKTEYKSAGNAVEVLDRALVAGYDAAVLRADTGEALTDWLKENGYDYSPAVAAWAKPYIEKQWVFTALKIAPQVLSQKGTENIEAKALRISFTTEQPLFPYREPKADAQAAALQKSYRILSLFFLCDKRYEGVLGQGEKWSGRAVWANELKSAQRQQLAKDLRLPEATLPAQAWLTELRDHWEYDRAQSDLYFSVAATQATLSKDPEIIYRAAVVPTDITMYALAAFVCWPLWRRKSY